MGDVQSDEQSDESVVTVPWKGSSDNMCKKGHFLETRLPEKGELIPSGFLQNVSPCGVGFQFPHLEHLGAV